MLKLSNFEGPLDLLLQLIEQQELHITEISLSQVTEQFFVHLDKMGRNRSSELADFLVIAAKLIFLKSKNLLPYLNPEEDEGESLADQLKMYKRYVEASKNIDELWSVGSVAYGRIEPPIKLKEFVLPANAGLSNLRQSMALLVQRLKPISPLPEVTIDYSISVKERIDNIRNMLLSNRKLNFDQLLSVVQSKTEVIVSFLALLDLLKKRDIMVRQQGSFGEMVVQRI